MHHAVIDTMCVPLRHRRALRRKCVYLRYVRCDLIVCDLVVALEGALECLRQLREMGLIIGTVRWAGTLCLHVYIYDMTRASSAYHY